MTRLIACAVLALALAAPAAHAQKKTDRKLHFTMSGWSAFYNTASGTGKGWDLGIAFGKFTISAR